MDSLRTLILVPTVIEQIFLKLLEKYFDVQIIGPGANCVKNIRLDEDYERVILFGMCGIMQHAHRKDVLFVPNSVFNWSTKRSYGLDTLNFKEEYENRFGKDKLKVWKVLKGVTTDFSVNNDSLRNMLLDVDCYDFVDQEDAWVAAYFNSVDVRFSVVRYGIDYCDRGLKNKAVYRTVHRYFQHWRMQRLFKRRLISGIR